MISDTGLPTLWDTLESADAVQARDEAIARVAEHAPVDWMVHARKTVLEVAAALPSFTTDDVWARIASAPPEPRALGAVMKALSSEGRIRATAAWRQSTRVECHARPVRVWERA